MQNKMLLNCSFLVLAILFAAVSAQAQGFNSYRAHVPFDFIVGDENFEAGDYVIRVENPNNLSAILTVRKEEGDKSHAIAVLKSGKTSKTDRTVLVFNRLDDLYALKLIASPDFALSAPKAGTATWMTVSKNSRKKLETVALVLRR